MPLDDLNTRWALIVGHPGHELRVWAWMGETRPMVAVLTDGSGSAGRARLSLTRDVCVEAGARCAPVFGGVSDREVYRAILEGNAELFLRLSETLAATLVADGIDAVAGDAIEGYNPTHDVCRFVIDRAVRLAGRQRPIANYQFAVVGSARATATPTALVKRLSPAEVAAKLSACRRYAAAAGGTLFGEVAAMLDSFDADEFSWECLVRVEACRPSSTERPFYERYGEQQVAAGRYDVVIRRDEHIAVIERALEA